MSTPLTLPLSLPLQLLGSPDAAACEGDACLIPEQESQSIVNRRLDEDAV